MKTITQKLKQRSRIYIYTIIIGLVMSGLTAFPIETELVFLIKHNEIFPNILQAWFINVHTAVKNANQYYPFLGYGTDWLAFAHLMLAILFIGALKDPVRNKWIIKFGIVCCLSIIPLALIAGNFRQIPIIWQLIDCSFGIIGLIPLMMCFLNIKKIEAIELNY